MDICDTLSGASRLRGAASAATPLPGAAPGAPGSKPFDAMNGLAAHALLNMTSSMRFEGSLNVDLNDITMNLVPYPRLHFLLASMSPLSLSKDLAKQAAPRSVDQVFSDALAPAHQLAKVDPRTGTYLALGLIMRGQATITDVNRNIARLRPSLRMAHWASEGFKVGLCAQPPVGMPYSLLALANNSAIAGTFTAMRDRFNKLYSRKFYAHHYEQYMEPGQFEAAAETVTDLIDQYQAVDAAARAPPPPPVRRVPKGLSFL